MAKTKKKGVWPFRKEIQVADEIQETASQDDHDLIDSDAYAFEGAATVSSLLSAGNRQARARANIYAKWAEMEANPIVSTALQLQVTGALGGHETTGALVFIERAAHASKDAQKARIADEVAKDLGDLFNRIAFEVSYTGSAFGDAYARLYSEDKVGIVDINTDEMFRPTLVLPFQRGTRTVGFTVATGKKAQERLSIDQMARFKMPRTQWVPQHGVVQKAIRMAITEDDPKKLPLLPAMAGGSLLYNAEDAYNKLNTALIGLVGQRQMDSIDEEIVTLKMDGMTKEQQKKFQENVVTMLKKSKEIAEHAVRTGEPFLERVKHILPVFHEKQIQSISKMSEGGRNTTISTEDIMLHARMLAGSLGTDLSMVGFADQLSGGLGDGGFFRMSAQAAERARIIRSSLSHFLNHIVDIHTLKKYGLVFKPGERPWVISFYGSISALEAERQKTQMDKMNTALMVLGGLSQLRELGWGEQAITQFLTKEMLLDEDDAKVYAEATTGSNDEAGHGAV